MMSTRLAAALSLISCLTLAPVALADVGPPDDNGCTVRAMEKEGTTCEGCGASHTDFEACSKKYAGTNFKYACKTSGASVWTEVWCDGPPANDDEEDEGCAFTGGPAGSSGIVVAGGLIAAAAAWARRRRVRRASSSSSRGS